MAGGTCAKPVPRLRLWLGGGLGVGWMGRGAVLVERLQYSRESCLCSWNCLIVLVVNGFLGSCVEEKLQFLFNN